MTVYELIQELSQFKADTKVEFHVKANFDTDVEVEFDRDNEDDTQEVTVTAEFDEDVDFDDIEDYERYTSIPKVVINFEY